MSKTRTGESVNANSGVVHPYNKAALLLVGSESCSDALLVPIGGAAGVRVRPPLRLTSTSCSKMATLTAAVRKTSSKLSPRKQWSVSLRGTNRSMPVSVLMLAALAALLGPAAADGKTLVLLDNMNIRDTHSIFFRSLAGKTTTLCSKYMNVLQCSIVWLFSLRYKVYICLYIGWRSEFIWPFPPTLAPCQGPVCNL